MAHVTKIEDQKRSSGQQGGPARATVTADAVDERQLVRLAQKGEKAAFETLVHRHQHRVFAVARGILKRQERCRRRCPTGFRQSLFLVEAIRSASGFSTWLYKITVNECWDLLRKRRPGPWYMSPTSAKSNPDSIRRSNGKQQRAGHERSHGHA